jgi:glycosyltransferase involved in cell wall biosynthesis
MTEPLVTIIVPVGPDHRQYLPRSLASLRAQTVDCWAALIVNDSGEPLDVPALDTEGRQGPAVARNLGLELTETPFVFFLDADDELPPDALEVLIRAYVSYQEVGYVYGDYTVIRAGEPPDAKVCANYMRPALAHGSLHPVSFLLPTAAALIRHWRALRTGSFVSSSPSPAGAGCASLIPRSATMSRPGSGDGRAISVARS